MLLKNWRVVSSNHLAVISNYYSSLEFVERFNAVGADLYSLADCSEGFGFFGI